MPTTCKRTRGSSKQRTPAPGGKATKEAKRQGSRDVSASPSNPSTKSRPAQSTGVTVVGKNAVPTAGGSRVPTTHKGTQGSSKGKKPNSKGKSNASKTVAIYLFPNAWGSPGHTTSVVVATTSANSALQPTTTSSLFLPSTGGPPAQHTRGTQQGNHSIPKTATWGIAASPQYNAGPPHANTGGPEIDDIVARMAGLHISSDHQNSWSRPSTNTGGAAGTSTTSTTTGNTNGPPGTQTTRSAPNHSTDGATGVSARKS